jgi:DNA-binding NarL/FixJ family response regulator
MLKGVVQGDAPISRAMAGKILGEFGRQARREAAAPRPGADLSPREKEVLELVTQGQSNKEIAVALAIAENTVKNHLKNILEKLHLENRVQAATFALRQGLVSKPPLRPDE